MKFKIREPRGPTEPEVEVWLQDNGAGDVDLKGSLSGDDEFFLVGLLASGKVIRPGSIPPEFGFKLTEGGRIVDSTAGK